jgi:hypothetical protein
MLIPLHAGQQNMLRGQGWAPPLRGSIELQLGFLACCTPDKDPLNCGKHRHVCGQKKPVYGPLLQQAQQHQHEALQHLVL